MNAALDPAARLVLRGLLSAILGWAAWHKLRDVGAFRAAVEAYELAPPLWAVPIGAALIAAELAIAVGLWLPRVGSAAAMAAAALLLLYGTAIAINLARGRRDLDCGCAGPAGELPISSALVARNLVLAALAAASALPGAARPWHWLDAVTVAAGVIALAALYAVVDGLLANTPALRRLRALDVELRRDDSTVRPLVASPVRANAPGGGIFDVASRPEGGNA